MERISQKAPLPCFALEHDKFDPKCQTCPHQDSCVDHMLSRKDKVPLNQVKFNLTPEESPEKYKAELQLEEMDVADPELPYLQRLYCDCFASVFHRNPTDNISLYREEIAKNARLSECSVRMYMLANMVAHSVHEKTVIANSERQRTVRFRAKFLCGALGVKRAKTYQEMCNDRFGTFSLTSLAILEDSDKSDIESTMLRSEVTAACWLVRYKIFNSGPGALETYRHVELELAPEWLAIEQTYLELVLKPYRVGEIKGTETLDLHRFTVNKTHGYYKTHLSSQKLAFLSRQRIMPQAVQEVLGNFNHRPDDFLYPRTPVNKPMEFWQALALTIRHYHCWLYLNNEPSFFTPRRNEKLVPRVPRS